MARGEKTSDKLRYQFVVESLKRRINGGDWPAGQKIPAERELEKELGVSRTTVSKGLATLEADGLLVRRQGSGTFVSERSSLARNRTRWVKSLCPAGPNNGRASVKHGVLEGAYDALGRHGFQVGVDFYQTLEEQIEFLDRSCAPGEGGVLVWFEPAPANVAALARLREREIPFVVLDSYPAGQDVDFAVSDNVEGGVLMVQYLVEMGHRRIGYLSRPIDRSSLRDRMTGFLQGVVTHQLPFSSEDVVIMRQPWNRAAEDLPQALEHFLAVTPRPTALCFSNDDLALTAADYLRQKGLRVPQDISLVGYDNVEQSKIGPIFLTTVQQDFYGMGKAAGEIVGERLNGVKNGRPNHVLIKPELVVRDSVVRRNLEP
jgi:GntR family transcriptional regulator, arabinose operon transcriptional repressor